MVICRTHENEQTEASSDTARRRASMGGQGQHHEQSRRRIQTLRLTPGSPRPAAAAQSSSSGRRVGGEGGLPSLCMVQTEETLVFRDAIEQRMSDGKISQADTHRTQKKSIHGLYALLIPHHVQSRSLRQILLSIIYQCPSAKRKIVPSHHIPHPTPHPHLRSENEPEVAEGGK